MRTLVSGTILDDSERPWAGFLRFTRHLTAGESVIGDLTPREIPTQADGGFEIELRPGRYKVEIGNQSPILITVPEGGDLAYDIELLKATRSVGVGGSGWFYWGSSTSETVTGSTIASTFTRLMSISIVGSKEFTAGGFKFFCWPDAFGDPRAFNGFRDPQSGSPIVMAGADQGFSESGNGWGYRLVSIDGEAFRLYRTLYQINAAVSFLVLK